MLQVIGLVHEVALIDVNGQQTSNRFYTALHMYSMYFHCKKV